LRHRRTGMRVARRTRMDASPEDIRVTVVSFGADELVVVSFPIANASSLEQLAPSEREIALAVVSGRTNAEIARARRRSVRTIANQVASIFRKLGVGSRAELAAALAGQRRP